MNSDSPFSTDLQHLIDLVARLRAPDGCPWDQKQTLPDTRAYLVEEAHEAAAAIDGGRWAAIGEELGDLLFQVAFVARLGQEGGNLDPASLVEGVHRKMIERHPHVFGAAEQATDAEAVERAWEQGKKKRRGEAASVLDGVPASLPALVAAYRMGQKAAGVGFDWPDAEGVFAKLDEEVREVRDALQSQDKVAVREELGDLLLTTASLCRKLGVDPEGALAQANLKFRSRFQQLEGDLRERQEGFEGLNLEQLEARWQEVKSKELESDSSGIDAEQSP